MYRLFALLIIFLLVLPAKAATVLLYHHVASNTPKSTSVSTEQFKQHLALIDELKLEVVDITTIVDAIANNQAVKNNWVAITFDDGYRSVYDNAWPILKQRGWPFSVFINPDMVKPSKLYMDWQQLKTLSNAGITIANHTLAHENLTDSSVSITSIKQNIEAAESQIKQQLGQNHKMLAYPFGEYSAELKTLLKNMGYIGWAQHSGAINQYSDLQALTRFPANGIYANVKTLKNKIRSLPFNIKSIKPASVITNEKTPKLIVELDDRDFYKSQLQCFISGINKPHKVTWQSDSIFTVKASEAIGKGRIKYNCTAPSIKHRGHFYWMSKLWINK